MRGRGSVAGADAGAYEGESITVLAVSVDVDDSNYRRFVRDHSVNLLTVRDADQKSNALYGTFKFPEPM